MNFGGKMNKLLVVVSYKWWFFSAVETLQAVYLAYKFMHLKFIFYIIVNYLGCGVGGVLFNNRWDQWVWSMSLEPLRKSWSL